MTNEEFTEAVSSTLMMFMKGSVYLMGFIMIILGLGMYFKWLFFERENNKEEKSKVTEQCGVKINVISEDYLSYTLTMKNLIKVNFFKKIILILSGKEIVKIGNHNYLQEFINYDFETEVKYYEMIRDKVEEPLQSLHEDSLLLNFYPSIHYSLSQLSQLNKFKEQIELEEYIEQAATLINTIKIAVDDINNQAKNEADQFQKEALENILTKHDLNMKLEIAKAQIYTVNRND
jgi:hypothetical protein